METEGRRAGFVTQQEIERMVILESTLQQLTSEVDELLSRRFPWLQIISIAAPIVIIALGFSFQNLLQLQIVAERQTQYQRSLESLLVTNQKQIDLLAAEDRELKRRIDSLEKKLRI